MYEELIINPQTHERALLHVISYINSRLEKILQLERVNVFTELVSLLNYAIYTAQLKGNHIPKIRATLFGLIKDHLGEEVWYFNKGITIEELKHHKELMENDITGKLAEQQDNKQNFYVLAAYFPSYEKKMSVGLMAKGYYEAAKKIRKRFGEFHLQDKKDFKKFNSVDKTTKNNLEFFVIF